MDKEFRERAEKMYGLTHSEIRTFKHSHLVNIPHNSDKYSYVNIEKPSPIFNPFKITNLEQYQDVFMSKEKLEEKLDYYKQLHEKEPKQKRKKKGAGGLPSYLVEVAKNIEQYEDNEHSYTGGVLDCIHSNNATYIMWAGLKQPVHIVDLNKLEINTQIYSSDDLMSVYNIKSTATENGFLLATRQKQKISLFGLALEEDNLKYSLLWKVDGKKRLSDMALNEFNNSEFSVVDENHNLTVADVMQNQVKITNSFPNNYNYSNLTLGQITYVDVNTLCFMNRCCIYLLDVRSSSIQKSCLKMEGLECDDLCVFSKNVDHHRLCISSQHNLIKFDIRALKCQDRIMHMLSTSPFLSSLVTYEDNEYISVMGSDYKDKTIFNNTKDTLNLPQYVPNIFDTYRSTSLSSKVLKFSEYIDKRLSLPNLGAKLHIDEVTKEVTLYTLNTIGDVFKQKIINNKSIDSRNDVLVNWVDALPEASKSFEVFGCFKLDYVMDNMSKSFPKKKQLKAYLKNDNSTKFLEDHKNLLEKYAQNNVAIAINSVWNLKEDRIGSNRDDN